MTFLNKILIIFILTKLSFSFDNNFFDESKNNYIFKILVWNLNPTPLDEYTENLINILFKNSIPKIFIYINLKFYFSSSDWILKFFKIIYNYPIESIFNININPP